MGCPIFFNDSLTWERYLTFLTNKIEQFSDAIPLVDPVELSYQQTINTLTKITGKIDPEIVVLLASLQGIIKRSL